MSALKIFGAEIKRNRGGFSLAELMVSLAVTTLIVVGSLLILGHLVVASAENRDQIMARLQAQYVGFWINEDVLQAQEINVDYGASGFPLVIYWVEGYGEETEQNQVAYTVVEMQDEMGSPMWMLKREHEIDGISQGISMVAEYLIPWDSEEQSGTRCFRKVVDEVPVDILVLEVTSRVDRKEASLQYEIHPRATVFFWE